MCGLFLLLVELVRSLVPVVGSVSCGFFCSSSFLSASARWLEIYSWVGTARRGTLGFSPFAYHEGREEEGKGGRSCWHAGLQSPVRNVSLYHNCRARTLGLACETGEAFFMYY